MNPVLLLVPLLVAWTLAGGGGGCSTAPPPSAVRVPFTCTPGAVYHWGAQWHPEIPGWEVYAYESARDCEYNGANDAGPDDTDESNARDARTDWLYFIDVDGSYASDSVVWCPEGGKCDTGVWSRLDFSVAAGEEYTIATQQTGNGLATTQLSYDVACPGMEPIEWYEWISENPPLWTAPESGICHFESYDLCRQAVGTGPAGTCGTLFSVWQR